MELSPLHLATPERRVCTAAPTRTPALDAIARCIVEDFRAAPCASVASAYRAHDRWQIAVGAFGSIEPGGLAASPDSPFDLASVTKPFSALAVARIVRRGLVDFSTPLGALVQEAVGTPTSEVPLDLLLAHRSGLDGHRPLFAPLTRGRPVDHYASLQESAMARRPDCRGRPPPDGFAPVYSDLGYLLLGEAISRAAARSLDLLVQSEVCQHTGSDAASARLSMHRDSSFLRRVVPTEFVDWRGGVVRGLVHDENAWALCRDGMCAHAGLFGTAAGVAHLAAAVLDALEGRCDAWLRPRDVHPLIQPRPGGTLRAGFDGKSPSGSSAGVECSEDTFGHLGFTGTSLWIDPRTQTAVVVLTNRVHPTRAHEAIKQARPVAHDALFRFAIAHSV